MSGGTGFKSARENDEINKAVGDAVSSTPIRITPQKMSDSSQLKVGGNSTTKRDLIAKQPVASAESLPDTPAKPLPSSQSLREIQAPSTDQSGSGGDSYALKGHERPAPEPELAGGATASGNDAAEASEAVTLPGGATDVAEPIQGTKPKGESPSSESSGFGGAKPEHASGFHGADGAPAIAAPQAPTLAGEVSDQPPVGDTPGGDGPAAPGEAGAGPNGQAQQPVGNSRQAPAPAKDPKKSLAGGVAGATTVGGAAGAKPPANSKANGKDSAGTPGSSKTGSHRADGPAKMPWGPSEVPGKGKRAKSGRVGNYAKRHPKGTIAMIIGFVSLFMSVIAFILAIPFQILQIAQQLRDHNFKPTENTEQKATSKATARLINERAKMAREGAKYPSTIGKPIRNTIAKFNNAQLDKLNQSFAKEGFKLRFDTTGRLTGLEYLATQDYEYTDIKKGDVVSVEDLSDKSIYERRSFLKNFTRTYSEKQIPLMKLVYYDKLLKFHARVSWKFWPKEKITDFKKFLVQKIRQGDTSAELFAADPEADPNSDDGNKDASEADKVAEEKFLQTNDKTLSISEGARVFKAKYSKVFGLTGILAIVCGIKQMADDASNEGYITRAMQLMRNGNAVLTIVSQMRTGENLDIDKFGTTMSIFMGNSKADKDSVDRKGWDQSAAARRILGQKVITNPKSKDFNPDLSEASNPDGFALKKITGQVDRIFDGIPGAAFGCKAVTGILGIIIGGVEFAVEAFATEGLADAAVLALKTAVTVGIYGYVLPKLLAWTANLAITGTENSTDFFNNADAGLLLSAMDEARSYGGRKMSNGQRVALIEASNENDAQIAREKGWMYRTFAFSNSKSTLSQLVMKMPNTPSTAIASITSLPQHLFANMGAIFFRPSFAAATDAVDVNPYSFQFYGFTNDEINKYDMMDNEDYLTAPVAGTTQTRLSVLGDPSTYTPADGDDASTTDLMHCFVNKFRSPDELKDDEICNGIGQPTAGNESKDDNPDDATINKIYQKAGLGVTSSDDFLRYRLELLYSHVMRGIECSSTTEDCFASTASASPIATDPTAPAPTGDVKSLAQQILANGNVTYWTNHGVNTRDVLVALAAGKPAYTTCTAAVAAQYGGGVAPNATADINPNILKFILEAAGKGKIMVNALTDKCHSSPGSNHYKGKAVDLQLGVGSLADFIDIAKKYGGVKNSETGHHHFDFE